MAGEFEIKPGVPEPEPRGKRWESAVRAAFANPGSHIELNAQFRTPTLAARLRRQYRHMRGENGERLRSMATPHHGDWDGPGTTVNFDGSPMYYTITIWAELPNTVVSDPSTLADGGVTPPLFEIEETE